MKLRLLTFYATVILAAVVPAFGLALCLVIITIQLALMGLRPSIAILPTRLMTDQQNTVTPEYSVHVATHAEPPHLVIRTLEALLKQDWPHDRYEIIVMDNNTADPALWRTVADFCAAHPDRITFIHQIGVSGAKAGALNIALRHTATAATHIVTVDADYVVHPEFLSRASLALQRTGADYVQFPQSYVGTGIAAPGIDAELEEYFRTNAAVADEAEAVLLTGTLCVISKAALAAAGGWSGATTTEDAELGVRLCNAGFAGRFINQVVGQGLLPLSLKDLERQRYRWCSGNLQTLVGHVRTILRPSNALNLHKRLVIVSQLTAWCNLALVPAFLLSIWLVTDTAHPAAVMLAAAIVMLSLCDIAIRVMARGLRGRLPLLVLLRALACRVALAPQSAKATFDALAGTPLRFVVTNKFGGTGTAADDLHLCHLSLFTAATILLIGVHPTNPLIIGALLTLMMPLPAAMLTDRSLRTYRETIGSPPSEGVA